MKKIFIYSIFCFILCLICISFISAALTDSLRSYYSFDGSAEDNVSIYDWTLFNGPTWVAGKIGGAISFDEASDQFGISNYSYFFNNTDFTVSVWMLSDGAQTFQGIMSERTGGAFQFQMGNGKYNPGNWTNFNVIYKDDTGISTPNFTAGNYNFYVATLDNLNLSVWIDGKYIGSQAQTEQKDAINPITALGQKYGQISYYGTNTFGGDLDELGIWNRALTSSEITELYNSGDGLAYPFVSDTCTCPGAGNDWEIDMSDYCNITDACDLGTGTLSFTGAGITTINSEIKITNLGDPGSSGLLKILSDCIIWIKGI